MPTEFEQVQKLQPNRAIHLRGFDSLGASAALHHATASSFEVSGVFRDPADFCVLMLHDSDNFFEHPSIRYLPDADFAGITLTFDVHYSGLRPLDSPRYATIDWPYLDVIPYETNPSAAHPVASVRVPLFAHATQVGGTWTAASGQFTITADGVHEGDSLRLWYLNNMFEYDVPKMTCSYAFAAAGAGTIHRITVAGTDYRYTEATGETEYSIAQRLADLVNASAWVTAVRTYGQVDITARVTDGRPVAVSCSDSANAYALTGVDAGVVAAALARTITGADWAALNVTIPLTASATGAVLTVAAALKGVDGNAITMYAVASSTRLRTAEASVAFTGGVSDATWRVTLDFSALGIEKIRQMWMTFAPPVTSGRAFTDLEWQASFSNWTVSGNALMKVAGPESVRVDSGSPSCVYHGAWNTEAGFYNRGYARRCTRTGDAVTITYDCPKVHDLYVGTSLYTDRGTVGASLDGGAEVAQSCYLATDSAVVARRKLFSNVAAGRHTVTLRSTGGYFYFDFLEAAVASDVPPVRSARAYISPALDYSTDHTYKLPPARILWIFDHLGMTGPIDQYVGVFWWNQRKRVNAVIPSATVTFGGTFAPGDQVFLNIGGLPVGKTVFAGESNPLIASHFAWAINATSVGVWASTSGNVLTITAHSPTAAYAFELTHSVEPAGSAGTVTVGGSLTGGAPGEWVVDPEQTPALNRGARDWHSDFYAECAARKREVATAVSMELVNPPESFAARFAGGAPVITSVGFGSLNSTHCAFSSGMRAYQQQVFEHLCALQSAAGLTPEVQFGEFCWWYFASGGSMAFYDAETAAAAETALGRPLHVFTSAGDDPQVNGGADAAFLRDRLRDHVGALVDGVRAAYPAAKFELLFPDDVNYPVAVGVNHLGGPLLRFINFPPEWASPATAPFDYLKVEALDFGSATRSLTLARQAIGFAAAVGWPKSRARYLMPVFNGGCPWLHESRMAMDAGVPSISLWAFDHVCLFNLELVAPRRLARATRFV